MPFLPHDWRHQYRRVSGLSRLWLTIADLFLRMIAIMLGRLEMSIDDCIKAYSSMMDSVFTKKQHRVDIRGGIQARFDTAELEKCIKSIVQQYTLGNNQDALMRDRDVSCKV